MLHPFGKRTSSLGRAIVAAAITVAWPAAAPAQDGPKYDTWTKAEASAEARDYIEQIKGGTFDEKSKAFLERIALPQLGLEGNRKTIERVRRRIRDYALNERTAGGDAVDAANKAAVAWLAMLARQADAEAVVRVNAMLLIGELRAKDGRPWPGAGPVLAAAAADPNLSPAVRVAAAAGLARHVDAARAASAVDPAFVQEAGKRLQSIIAAPPPAADRAAGEWLVARALDMLPVVSPKATAEGAAAMVKILDDPNRPPDVRVRAAAALGATATAEARIDAGRAVTAVRGLGLLALKADRDAAAERALARQVGGPAVAAAQPGFGAEFSGANAGLPAAATAGATVPIKPLVARRDAWRLATLANAIKPAEGDRGLASLLPGDRKAAAEELAKALRAAAGSLDSSPDVSSVKDAIESLERVAQPATAPASPVEKPASAAKPAPPSATPAAPAPSEPNDPFGAPAN